MSGGSIEMIELIQLSAAEEIERGRKACHTKKGESDG
jgi:hypothetical protein